VAKDTVEFSIRQADFGQHPYEHGDVTFTASELGVGEHRPSRDRALREAVGWHSFRGSQPVANPISTIRQPPCLGGDGASGPSDTSSVRKLRFRARGYHETSARE
jgi:hypothetical protein